MARGESAVVVAAERRPDDIGVYPCVSVRPSSTPAICLPNPFIAIPALLMTKSIPSPWACFRCSANVSTLLRSVMSSWWYVISDSPPSAFNAFACFSWESSCRSLSAASPLLLSRAVR